MLPNRPSSRALALIAALVTVLAVTAAPAEAAVNLHRGSTGAKVRLLESRLHRVGLLPQSAVDRRYRQATVNAVKRFQRRVHVPVTGRVNTRTWNLLAQAVVRASKPSGPPPSVIGHRGAGRPGLPENTLEALRYAHGWADVLEFDLRLTSDHVFVLMHDETLDRTTSCSGPVSSWTSQDLRSRCRTGGQVVPTLAEVASYLSRVGEQVAPELKDEQISDSDLDAFLSTLDQYGLTGRAHVQSLVPAVLRRVKAQRPGLRTVLVAKDIPSVPLIKGSQATTVAVRIEDVTAARVKLYKDNGLRVWVYTALDQAGVVRAWALHATAVVTDVPRQARNYYGR